MTLFQEQIRDVVRNITAGETMSYKEVAEVTGRPRAFRAVATTMANNFDPTVPCHRVIKSDGSLGGYNRGGEEVKKRLLQAEGIVL